MPAYHLYFLAVFRRINSEINIFGLVRPDCNLLSEINARFPVILENSMKPHIFLRSMPKPMLATNHYYFIREKQERRSSSLSKGVMDTHVPPDILFEPKKQSQGEIPCGTESRCGNLPFFLTLVHRDTSYVCR